MRRNFLSIRDVTLRVVAEVREFANRELGVVVKWYQDNLPLIKEAIQTALNFVRDFWRAHGEELTAIVRSIWDLIKGIVGAGINVILDLIKLTLQAINGDWKGVWQTAYKIVADIGTGIARAIKALGDNAVAQTKLIAGLIFDFLKTLPVRMKELGEFVIAGFVEGIKAGAGLVTRAIKEVVTLPIDVARKALGIRSPSTVFREIGGQIVEGLALGVDSSHSRVRDTFSSLFDSILSLADRGLNAVTNRFGAFGGVINGLLRSVAGSVGQLLGSRGGAVGALGNLLGGLSSGGGLPLRDSFGRFVSSSSSGGNLLAGLLGGGITAPASITPSLVGGLPVFGNVPVPLIGGGGLPGAARLSSQAAQTRSAAIVVSIRVRIVPP